MYATATGSTAEIYEYGNVIDADLDDWGDLLVVVVRLVVVESSHDATVVRVELDGMSGTNAGSDTLKGERARAGAGRDDELNDERRICPCKRALYPSATAVRSRNWNETISQPAGKTNAGVGSAVVATCGRRATASRLFTPEVEESATATEAMACTPGSVGGGSKKKAT